MKDTGSGWGTDPRGRSGKMVFLRLPISFRIKAKIFIMASETLHHLVLIPATFIFCYSSNTPNT